VGPLAAACRRVFAHPAGDVLKARDGLFFLPGPQLSTVIIRGWARRQLGRAAARFGRNAVCWQPTDTALWG
jgi:hypothetical protein